MRTSSRSSGDSVRAGSSGTFEVITSDRPSIDTQSNVAHTARRMARGNVTGRAVRRSPSSTSARVSERAIESILRRPVAARPTRTGTTSHSCCSSSHVTSPWCSSRRRMDAAPRPVLSSLCARVEMLVAPCRATSPRASETARSGSAARLLRTMSPLSSRTSASIPASSAAQITPAGSNGRAEIPAVAIACAMSMRGAGAEDSMTRSADWVSGRSTPPAKWSCSLRSSCRTRSRV